MFFADSISVGRSFGINILFLINWDSMAGHYPLETVLKDDRNRKHTSDLEDTWPHAMKTYYLGEFTSRSHENQAPISLFSILRKNIYFIVHLLMDVSLSLLFHHRRFIIIIFIN
uniref:Uncharacterized protein n=1 Tax=Cacopsylla melanoneura TaxID=428564 RepID=A0A8D8RS84_9HEMI